MQLEFSNTHYNDPASMVLTPRLEAFFNRADIQQKLQAAAQHMVPNGQLRGHYALSSYELSIFDNAGGGHDGNPFNLASAVITAYKDLKADRTAPAMVTAGMESVAKQLVSVIDLTTTDSELKSDIMRTAKHAGITGKEKF